MIKISIITINYNNDKGLIKTIESIRKQIEQPYEYIIIDGNSSDTSKRIIKEADDIITYSISESDQGPYDAMNKGIAQSNGDYLLFLNSGDTLYKESTIYNLQHSTFSEGIIYTASIFAKNKNQWLNTYSSNLSPDYLLEHTLNHQNMLIKQSIITKKGGYDTTYKIISDWILVMELILNNTTYSYLEEPISVYNLDGISSSNKGIIQSISEKKHYFQSSKIMFSKTLSKYISIQSSPFYIIINRFPKAKLPIYINKILLNIYRLIHKIKPGAFQ